MPENRVLMTETGERLIVTGQAAIPKTTVAGGVTYNYQQSGRISTTPASPGAIGAVDFQTETVLHPGVYDLTLAGTAGVYYVFNAARVPE